MFSLWIRVITREFSILVHVQRVIWRKYIYLSVVLISMDGDKWTNNVVLSHGSMSPFPTPSWHRTHFETYKMWIQEYHPLLNSYVRLLKLQYDMYWEWDTTMYSMDVYEHLQSLFLQLPTVFYYICISYNLLGTDVFSLKYIYKLHTLVHRS